MPRAERGSSETEMKLDIASMSAQLASDMKLTDYDFWRGDALPMKMIYARHVLKTAMSQRLPYRGRTSEV